MVKRHKIQSRRVLKFVFFRFFTRDFLTQLRSQKSVHLWLDAVDCFTLGCSKTLCRLQCLFRRCIQRYSCLLELLYPVKRPERRNFRQLMETVDHVFNTIQRYSVHCIVLSRQLYTRVHTSSLDKNTNKRTKRVLSSIVTHSYMFRPCWVIFRENFLLPLH
jgi:hypothetical protein